MKTIHMGLNTDPAFARADGAIERWSAEGNYEMVEYWKKMKDKTLALRDEIVSVVENEGECKLSWSCTGRTLHEILSRQWADAMPEYDFEIGYNYHCVVRKRA